MGPASGPRERQRPDSPAGVQRAPQARAAATVRPQGEPWGGLAWAKQEPPGLAGPPAPQLAQPDGEEPRVEVPSAPGSRDWLAAQPDVGRLGVARGGAVPAPAVAWAAQPAAVRQRRLPAPAGPEPEMDLEPPGLRPPDARRTRSCTRCIGLGRPRPAPWPDPRGTRWHSWDRKRSSHAPLGFSREAEPDRSSPSEP
jgi:hypothetical protein